MLYIVMCAEGLESLALRGSQTPWRVHCVDHVHLPLASTAVRQGPILGQSEST